MFESVESNFFLQSMPPPWKRRSSQIVAKEGRATFCKSGGELIGQGKEWVSFWTWKEKGHIRYGVLFGLTTSGSCPIPEVTWNRCYTTSLKKWRSGTWVPRMRVCGGTSTCEPEESSDLSIDTKSGAIEERMQAANKAWWRDVKIYIRKEVPWIIKCRRMVEHVHNVFSLW